MIVIDEYSNEKKTDEEIVTDAILGPIETMMEALR